jgi:hypothetical protein
VLFEGLKAHAARDVALTFRDSHGNIACSVGSTVKPGGGVPDRHCVDLHWITHSQLLDLRFTNKRGIGLPSVCVWFFANILELSTEQKNGQRCLVMAHKMGDSIKDGNDSTRDIKAEGTGVALMLNVDVDGSTWLSMMVHRSLLAWLRSRRRSQPMARTRKTPGPSSQVSCQRRPFRSLCFARSRPSTWFLHSARHTKRVIARRMRSIVRRSRSTKSAAAQCRKVSILHRTPRATPPWPLDSPPPRNWLEPADCEEAEDR